MFYNLYLYKNFFTFQNMSYGATLAWLLFAITLVITLVLFGTARQVGLLRRRGSVTASSFAGQPRCSDGGRAVCRGRQPAAARARRLVAQSFLITLIAVLAVAAFLSPMLRSVAYSIKSIDQITQAHSPLYPADPVTFAYEGEELPILNVPMPDGTIRQLALLEPLRRQSTFIDPAAPDAAPIVWQGSWRTLEPVWQFAPALGELRARSGT